jgi:hypothetical protein
MDQQQYRSSLWLSETELRDATRRRQPAAQARVLQTWHVPYERRPDGTLLVSRVALDARLQGGMLASAGRTASGLNWTKRA